MRKCLLFLLILCVKTALSQISDSFSDGDFTHNPKWLGDTADFVVNEDRQLQTVYSSTPQTVFLSTGNLLAESVKWEFNVQLNFDPSAQNQMRIYLVSDSQDLTGNLNGYFIQIGENGNEDSYDLYRQTGTSSTRIIDGPPESRSDPDLLKVRIVVTRDGLGNWELKTASGDAVNFASAGTVSDNTFTETAFFGIFCKYTTTRSDKFIFDDLRIESTLPADTIPPQLTAVNVRDSLTLEAVFNEAVNRTSASSPEAWSLNNNYGSPVEVDILNANTCLLKFYKAFETGNYTLSVHNVKDQNNNTIGSGNEVSFTYIKPYMAKENDVVINEIFADPTPQIDLPDIEFVELFNTSGQTIFLKGWEYGDAATMVKLPDDSIGNDEYLILCAEADTSEYKGYGRTIGISPWPVLNNDKDSLVLRSNNDKEINQVAYNLNWYKDKEKQEGGHSLELIDPGATCSGIQNWTASIDPSGGTPGRENSVFKSNTSSQPLKLDEAVISDSLTIILSFNRYIDSLSASDPENFSVNNGLGNPDAVLPEGPDFKQVRLIFSKGISRGKTYKVTVNDVSDCAGSIITSSGNTREFVYADRISKGNVLLNEVLFNPRPDGVDFVEIYNYSDKILNLEELSIATIKDDSLVSILPVTREPYLFEPGKYLVLTIDPDRVKQEYRTENPDAFIEMASMPAYNDKAGTVVLLSAGNRIDQFSYSEKMHFPLIKDPEGVSLERSSFKRPANEPGNFRSAAASAGYATPGYKNSQYQEESEAQEEVSLSSETFSPDADGFEDYLDISYHFNEAGRVANISIYNDRGVLIRRLVRNSTLGTQGTFTWDGINDSGEKALVGIYLVYFEVFDVKGNVKKYLRKCVLAAKLN